jgi:serine/threonine protein phosphatase PrpC
MTIHPNQQKEFSFTRKLYDYQCEFYQKADQDQTISGLIKSNLVGRIITVGVSFILHAEAVCRAVFVCFLSIREIFSHSNEHTLEDQKQQFSDAYSESIKSFIALFHREILNRKFETSQTAANNLPQEIVLFPQLNNNQAAQEQINLQHEPVIALENPHPQPLLGIINQPPQHIEMIQINQNHFEQPEDDFEHLQNQPEIENPAEVIQNEGLENELQYVEVQQPNDYDAIHIENNQELQAEQQPLKSNQPNLILEGPYDEDDEKESFKFPQEEEKRLQTEAEKIQRRELVLQQQLKPTTPRTLKDLLLQNLIDATAEVELGDRNITYYQAPESHYHDPKWKFFRGVLDNHSVGGCHFANGQHALGAQHLATLLDLNIEGNSLPAPLFAIFDPQIGYCAAQYLVQQLPKTLSKHLHERNKNGLSQEGIFDALSITFLTLQDKFIEECSKMNLPNHSRMIVTDQGSSATVVLVLNGAIWTAQLGNSKAACSNDGIAIQLTSSPDPTKSKYEKLVHDLGGEIDENGLINGRIKMATSFGRNDLQGAISTKPEITTYSLRMLNQPQLIIGTEGLFKVTSTKRIVELMQKNKKLAPVDLAHDLVYTVHRYNQQSQNESVKNRSLSCLIVNLNSVVNQPKIDEDWEEI